MAVGQHHQVPGDPQLLRQPHHLLFYGILLQKDFERTDQIRINGYKYETSLNASVKSFDFD